MYLTELELEEFRSYRHLALRLDRRGLRITGPNASGKSSLVEAIAMLATTRSPRSTAEKEIISWESGTELGFPPFARLRGSVVRGPGNAEIEIGLQIDPERPGQIRKQIKLGGRPVRAMDAVGVLKAVLFSPEDIALVAGAPAGRRRYLDLTISQLDGAYLRALARYARVLGQRNSLLKTLGRTGHVGSAGASSQLAFWDDELVALGAAITARRLSAVHRLATLSRERFRALTDTGELDLIYRPAVSAGPAPARLIAESLTAMQAVIAREFEAQLNAIRADELRRGVTLVGPHRDDLQFLASGFDLALFGSRGQQRLAVVALKLAETALMTEVAGEAPVLLLDDVLSELDSPHRRMVAQSAAAAEAQVFVTATDQDSLSPDSLAGLRGARVEGGTIFLD